MSIRETLTDNTKAQASTPLISQSITPDVARDLTGACIHSPETEAAAPHSICKANCFSQTSRFTIKHALAPFVLVSHSRPNRLTDLVMVEVVISVNFSLTVQLTGVRHVCAASRAVGRSFSGSDVELGMRGRCTATVANAG